MVSRIACGSAMRPRPNSPHAISPSSGPTNSMPSAFSVARLRRVAGCSHMRTFMAGAASTRLSAASSTAVARSSASPCAILARRSAVAGATTIKSASRDRRICPISASSLRSNRSVKAFSSVSTESESGVTNSAPPLGEDRAHGGAPLLQAAHQLEALIGGDAAADDQQDALALHCSSLRSSCAAQAGHPRSSPSLAVTPRGGYWIARSSRAMTMK